MRSITRIICILTLALVLVCSAGCSTSTGGSEEPGFVQSSPPKTDYTVDDVLFTDCYANYAWGFTYSGTVLMSDGSLWKFVASESATKFNEDSRVWIIKGLTDYVCNLSDPDLQQLLALVSEVDSEKFEYNRECMDAGSNFVSLYRDGDWLTLSENGDFRARNTSVAAERIMQILTKYGFQDYFKQDLWG